MLVLWMLGVVAPEMGGDWFGLVPGRVLSNYRLWTFITAGPFETSLGMGAVNLLAFVVAGPCMERLWGSRILAVFVLWMDVLVLVTAFALMIGVYAVSELEQFVFRPLCGFSGVNAALAVAMKQRMTEQPLLPIPDVPILHRLQCQHLPALICTAAVLLWMTGWMNGKEVMLIWLGTLFSFLYLRFYFKDPDTGAVGDMRHDFAFSTLFPDILGLRGVVNLVLTVPFHAAMRAGFFSDALKSATGLPGVGSATSPSPSDASALLVGTANLRAVDPQAERRRILAIKAIDEKLAELAKHASNAGNTAAAQGAAVVDLPNEEELQRMEREVTGSSATDPSNAAPPAATVYHHAISVRDDVVGAKTALP